jgi:hypothetical protein
MKKTLLLICIILFTLIASCKDDEPTPTQSSSSSNPYVGSYTLNISGGATGSGTVTIDGSGNLAGNITIQGTTGNQKITGNVTTTGQVQNGKGFDPNNTQIVSFSGKFTSNTNANGTWSFVIISGGGTWTMAKQ